MRAALYLRRSTDEHHQPESLRIQEEYLRAFCAREDLDVVAVFPDSASGRSTKGREGFAHLMHLVQAGAPFEVTVLRDVTRWGRFENVDESAYWEFFCILHGVRVRYAEEHFDDTPKPYDCLMKTMRRMYAAEFSREKSRLIQAAQASRVRRGYRVGPPPFGMRLVVIGPDGAIVKRLAPGERKDSLSTFLKLEPSEDTATKTVRRIFRWYTTERLSMCEIVRRLNNKNVPAPRGPSWRQDTIRDFLANPAYEGTSSVRFERSQNDSRDAADVAVVGGADGVTALYLRSSDVQNGTSPPFAAYCCIAIRSRAAISMVT